MSLCGFVLPGNSVHRDCCMYEWYATTLSWSPYSHTIVFQKRVIHYVPSRTLLHLLCSPIFDRWLRLVMFSMSTHLSQNHTRVIQNNTPSIFLRTPTPNHTSLNEGTVTHVGLLSMSSAMGFLRTRLSLIGQRTNVIVYCECVCVCVCVTQTHQTCRTVDRIVFVLGSFERSTPLVWLKVNSFRMSRDLDLFI